MRKWDPLDLAGADLFTSRSDISEAGQKGSTRMAATGWQRQFAAAVRDAQRLGQQTPEPRRISRLATRFSKVRYAYGELLFALFVCRDSRLSKDESLKEYGFRLRLLGEYLDGSAAWRKQYERRSRKQQAAPADKGQEIEDTLWRARGLFSLLLADMETCWQLSEP